MGVIQPVIWLFLFGEMFRKVIDIPGFGYQGSYLAYLIPGIVAMNAMSSNMWAGMAHDRGNRPGHAQPLPGHPGQPPGDHERLGRRAGGEHHGRRRSSSWLLGYAGGARYPGGALGIVVLVIASIEVGVLWGALSNMTGMLLRAREAIIGVYTFFMLPLMFLSSAFIQPGFLPGWMQAIASRNPLNWEVQIGRAALSASPDWSAVAVRCGGLLILALIAVAVSVRTFRSYAKNV